MTSQASVHNGNPAHHPNAIEVGRDPVIIQDGRSERRGFTREEDWAAARLQGESVSPPILFEGRDAAETVDLGAVRVTFVHSHDLAEYADPIHFHDNLPHAELLWVRLVLKDGEQLEGMMTNSEDVIVNDMLSLIPTDPQTNHRKILFARGQVQEFHVLGVRQA